MSYARRSSTGTIVRDRLARRRAARPASSAGARLQPVRRQVREEPAGRGDRVLVGRRTRLSPQPLTVACMRAPPISSSETCSPITTSAMRGEPRYIDALPSTMNTTSQNAGMYAPPAADGPNRQHTCGTLPDSRTWLAKIRPAPRRPGNSSTWSVMRAPAESTRYTTGSSWLQRVLGEPHDLLDRARAPRARLHRRVVRHHAHRAAVDAADAGDDTVGREIAGERVGEQRVLDERVVVEEQREPVAHEQLVLPRELLALLGEIALRARARCARGSRSASVTRRTAASRAPACSSALGSSRPTISCASARAVDAARRGRCPSRSPCRRACARDPRSPRCPTRPGAYGQPPSPPIDASKRVTPRSSAATTLASAVPRVLWKCSPIRSLVIPARSSASSRSSTRRGVAMPVVSPNESRSAPASTRCPAICATRSGATSPS